MGSVTIIWGYGVGDYNMGLYNINFGGDRRGSKGVGSSCDCNLANVSKVLILPLIDFKFLAYMNLIQVQRHDLFNWVEVHFQEIPFAGSARVITK